MNRIEYLFHGLRERGEKALVGFVTAGDPGVDRSLEIIHAMTDAGVDILELGVPFSDPTADGPVIQRSSLRAIGQRVSLRVVLNMVRTLRRDLSVSIVLFSYYNPILAYGFKRFYEDAVEAGVDGLLVVDLPPEEAGEMTSRWANHDLGLIRLVAPTTPPERMSRIAESASGFLYLVSMTGVTGADGLDTGMVSGMIASLRAITALPICVGFGISTPQQVAALAPLADGVVVGSALERVIEAHLDHPDCCRKIGEKVRELKLALSQPTDPVSIPFLGMD